MTTLFNASIVIGLAVLWLAAIWMFDRLYAGVAGGVFGRSLEARYGCHLKSEEFKSFRWSHAGYIKVGHATTGRVFVARHRDGLLLRAKSPFGHPMSCTLLVPWGEIRSETSESLGFKMKSLVIDSGDGPAGRIELGNLPYDIKAAITSPPDVG